MDNNRLVAAPARRRPSRGRSVAFNEPATYTIKSEFYYIKLGVYPAPNDSPLRATF